MNISPEVAQFASAFRAEVLARARGEDAGSTDGYQNAEFKELAFTERVMEILSEVGAIEDGTTCYVSKQVRNRHLKVNGYSLSDDGERLDIITTIFLDEAEPASVRMTDVQQAIIRALQFVAHARAGLAESMEPANPAHDMALAVQGAFDNGRLEQVNVVILTDGLIREVKAQKPLRIGTEEFDVRADAWDIERISRCVTSGRSREPIEIDFYEEFECTIPCLPVKGAGEEYDAYLAVVPGDVLHRLYDDYGERLLELNVRSFLQARGKVNRGIRDTIIKEPNLFFAYNNGITAIAEEVGLERQADGTTAIRSVRGIQIVNGGQTTASIHRAGKKDQADLSGVHVQMKLSRVRAELIDELVPRISLYANSQNKVNEADFSANDPFHQRIEELSRTVWAPGEQTRWFYERARGQYQVARARAGRKVQQFDAIHPISQMFTKTDLAYFENSWGELPHLVSRGAQKNFREFTLALGKRSIERPDEDYFRQLVAKAIIFRTARRLAAAAHIGAYRANIVTYTVAYVAHTSKSVADLEQVWQLQRVPKAMEAAMVTILGQLEREIINSANGRNVTEWCKREECWKHIRSLALPLPDGFPNADAFKARGGRRVASG